MLGTYYPHFGAKPQVLSGKISFCGEGTENPRVTSWGGSMIRFVQSITWVAPANYVITFKPEFVFPQSPTDRGPRFTVTGDYFQLADWYQVNPLGIFDATNRTLVLTTHRAGVAFNVPARDFTSRITVDIEAVDSTGA